MATPCAPLGASSPLGRRFLRPALGLMVGATMTLALGAARAGEPSGQSSISAESLKKAVAAALSRRRINEASARVLDPNLDETDVALLTDEELDLAPAELSGTEKPFAREPSPELLQPNLASASQPDFRYGYIAKLSAVPRGVEREIRVDANLARPSITIDTSDPLYPVVGVPKLTAPDGTEALYYFEFDTSITFRSPNFWRYPSLLPLPVRRNKVPVHNLTGRDGLAFNVLQATQRGVDGHENQVRFPFRAPTMRLPNDWAALNLEELEQQALALGYGLPPAEMINEIYRYGRHSYVWGDDTINRAPLDVFRAGVAQCSAVNNLIGAMLEMNGLRYRLVAGFSPKHRVFDRVGGHSGIEVFDAGSGSWSYVDSYLDILLPGLSTEMLARTRSGAALTPVSLPRPQEQPYDEQATRISLGEIFKYRNYGDQVSRLPMMSMLRLRASRSEREYGLDWDLNAAAPRPASELFPERQTIFVRARYILPGAARLNPLGEPGQPLPVEAPAPVASPWAIAAIELEPRALMERYPTPQTREKPNPCLRQEETGVDLTGGFTALGGHGYVASARRIEGGDLEDAPKRSRVVVCEDGRPLGPAHTSHDQIASAGAGRFSHWKDTIYFSASDNSDPNTNGRAYTVIVPPRED